MGKDWASPFFPPSKMFGSFNLLFSLLVYSKERSSFLNQRVNWYFYIVMCGKTGPAHFLPPPKCSNLLFTFYILDYVILLLYLNSFDLYQAENQVFNSFLVLKHFGVGERLSWPILSPLQNVLIILFIFWSFGLCCSFIASEHL